jgi:hypothetical protein
MDGWLIGLLGVLWVILFIWLGLLSLRKGHWIMFLVGIPLPVFWLVGALIPPVRR